MYLYRSRKNFNWQVTTGNEYYIKVTPYINTNSGTYMIGYTNSSTAPIKMILPTTGVTTLTLDFWADGNIATAGGVQWFKFTATTATQYIHFSPDVLARVYVQIIDNTGTIVGSKTSLFSSTKYTSQTVTSGNVYYIKVAPYSSSDSGAYLIGYTNSATAPAKIIPPTTGVTTLTYDVWADGNITAESGVQWFKFTATAATQYILRYSFIDHCVRTTV